MFILWQCLTLSLLSTIVSSFTISPFSIIPQAVKRVHKHSLNTQSDQNLVIDQNVIEQPLLIGMAGFTAVGSAISSRITATSGSGDEILQKKFFIETHGCQMNLADSDVVRSVLLTAGYEMCDILEDADLILTNTCAIRENAEAKIWQRLKYFASLRKKAKKEGTKPVGYPIVGVLGCMAERLKSRLLDDSGVDFIAGPDAYRELPNLLMAATTDQSAANTQLSLEETYADITPVRLAEGNTHAFVTITRGCNNHCAFCIVPYTRGKERSRPVDSVLNEVRALRDQGVKEVVLLGQNVNSFWDESTESSPEWQLQQEKYSRDNEPYVYTIAPGFTQRKKVVSRGTKSENIDNSHIGDKKNEDSKVTEKGLEGEKGVRFAELLSLVAAIDPDNMRIRFQSPHPKDFPDEVLRLVAETPNICNSLHMPAQHGNSEALERMKRGYSRDAYLSLVERARLIIGAGSPEGVGLGLSSDFISGFCGETEEEHKETVSLLKTVGFDQAFTYAYSRRDQTFAGLFFEDDVPDDVKSRRLTELVNTFQATSMARNNRLEVGRLHLVLIEGKGKKMINIPPSSVDTQYSQPSSTSNDTKASWTGRTDSNKRVVFPACTASSPILKSLTKEQAQMFASLSLPTFVGSSIDSNSYESSNSNDSRDVSGLIDLSGLQGGVDMKGSLEAVATLVRTMQAIKDQTDGSDSNNETIDNDSMIDKGSYVIVKIISGRGHTLRAAPIAIVESLTIAHHLGLMGL